MHKLVLLRHGESQWNRENRFTGWVDVDLSPDRRRGGARRRAPAQGRGLRFDIAYTSVLKRAIRTLWIALDELDRMWLPVEKHWRLNERHYGALQGLNKAEMAAKFGDAAGARLAAQLRHPAAAARAATMRATSAATRATPASRGAAQRMPEGHRGARAALLDEHASRLRSAPANAC